VSGAPEWIPHLLDDRLRHYPWLFGSSGGQMTLKLDKFYLVVGSTIPFQFKAFSFGTLVHWRYALSGRLNAVKIV
jgi:hypothetical protein